MAKKVGKTPNNNTYIILQDSPTSYHVSVDLNDIIRYEHIESPSSEEELMKRIFELEVPPAAASENL